MSEAVGNRTTMADDGTTYTYHYNQFNQLTSTEKGSDTDYASYEYDSRGNQTQEQIKKDFDGTEKTQTTEYTYNLLNRMTSATVTATGETTQTVSNTYNAQGQRIKKLENGGTTNYYYVGDEVQFTTTQNAFMLTENVLSPQGNIIASKRFADDDPATPDPYANKYYFYNYDLRGSVTSIIKPDGSRVKDYTYDEFGKLEAGGEQGFLNETTYTGSVKDKSTGLQYMNARYYEPETGRFLTQDTYTGNPYDPWTQHLYSYCGNNPTSMVDPTGHGPEAVAVIPLLAQIACIGMIAYNAYKVAEGIINHIGDAINNSTALSDPMRHNMPWMERYMPKGNTTAAQNAAKAVEIAAAAIASGAVIAKEIDKKKYDTPYAYRAMSKADYNNYMSGKGFLALNAEGNTTMEQHIAQGGENEFKHNSPFISASRLYSRAEYYYNEGKKTGDNYGIATIDLRQVAYIPAYAMNFSNPDANFLAGRDQEILILGSVPRSAIVKVDYLKKME